MQMGNPIGLRKKDQARPEALPPTSGQAVAGQANAHEECFNLIPYYVIEMND